MDEINCSAIFLDVRDFTRQLSDANKKQEFIRLIKDVYSCGLETCELVVDNKQFYINSTGDGFLIVVFSKNHYTEAFLLALLLHIRVTEVFKKHNWSELKEGSYYFGIGLESGIAYKVVADKGDKKIETYLGDVINVAARLEALSKEHARAPIIYGPELNELIVSRLFKKSYKELMELAKGNPCNPKDYHDVMNEINSKLLSSYLFEHNLKGVEGGTPVFRISPTLFLAKGDALKNFINNLPKEYKEKFANLFGITAGKSA